MILNKSSMERGFAHGQVYKSEFIDLLDSSGSFRSSSQASRIFLTILKLFIVLILNIFSYSIYILPLGHFMLKIFIFFEAPNNKMIWFNLKNFPYLGKVLFHWNNIHCNFIIKKREIFK